ncbi:MAG: phytanoyl-CoA dioxygenase family protein [Pseudomonadota bacterium]
MSRLQSTSDVVVTQDQLDHFNALGWVLLSGFYSTQDIAEMGQWVDDILVEDEAPGSYMVYYEDSLTESGKIIQRVENFCSFHSGFDSMCRDSRLTHALSIIMRGQEPTLFKDKINFKFSGGSGFEPHQDQQAGWSKYAPVFISALVCIDEATEENGCLELSTQGRATDIMGSDWKPLDAEDLIDYALKPVPTRPGDVVLFDSFVPHASKPNHSDLPRRLLYLTYNAASYGDKRAEYYRDKRASFPPDIEREEGKRYTFRV